MNKPLTNGELIEKLLALPANAPVVATWEGITRNVDVYMSKDGCVVVDADQCDYKLTIVQGVKKARNLEVIEEKEAFTKRFGK